MALETIGPRQTTGELSFSRNMFIDMTRMPPMLVRGSIPLPAERDSQQACDKRFANAAFAAHDGDDLFDSAIFTGRSHCQWYATPNRGLLGCDRDGLSLDDGVEVFVQTRLFFGRKAMRAGTTCDAFP